MIRGVSAAALDRSRRTIDPGRVHEIDAPAPRPTLAADEGRLREVATALAKAVEDPSFRLPMLPDTAAEALQLANDPQTPMNRLERVVARDAALAARMFAVATSPAYAGAGLRSLTAALQRLGAGTIRDILYQAVMECHVFRGNDRAMRSEREHAIAVGSIARALCGEIGFDPQYAFLCGLMHDLGRTALLTLRDRPPIDGVADDALEPLAVMVHAGLGARLAARWKLPALVCEGVRRHHRYRGFEADGGGYSQLGHVLALADTMARRLGAGRRAAAAAEDHDRIAYELGVDPARALELASAAARG